MPGLKNRTTWAPLLLKTSDITSCANGCSLGITAHLTYVNTDPEPVEGVFVYPLGEKEVVVGFEAVVSGRLVSVELQSRGKLEDCCLDCCPGSALHTQCGHSKEWGCHLLLDEDLERSTFIVSTGQIGPLEIVSVVISTTLELPTLENGAIRLVYPTVLTPIVRSRIRPGKNENGGKSDENRMLGVGQQCTHALLTSTATNLSPYQLSFQLLFRGACLLAGLESPTHALRADADPSAQSASATYITLAMEHSCDRHLEIILHLSEPHSPLVILERGRLTFSEYEQQIRARRDYIRFARKEAESEKRFVRRRYHKDLLLNPVLMLNFCPDLLSEPTELQQASRELIFLIDNSNTMTQHNINKIKVLAISCMSSCSSGTTFWHMLTQALEYIQKIRTDQGGANLWGALSWVYRQPIHRSCPRQLFIIMDGTCSNVGRVLELVRRNACNVRCFGLGLGPQACRRLLQGVAKVTGGSTEFLNEEERLQPKVRESTAPSTGTETEPLLSTQFKQAGKLLDESRRRQKALARSALAGRSFSSPQGDLDMHRLRRALEKVSFEQAVGGRLEESDTDTHSTSRGGLSRPSLTDSNGLLFPASPLDWDTFTDPEGLFSAAPPGEFQASGAECRSVIHGMLGGRAVSWEVRVDLSLLWDTESSATLSTSTGSWDEIIHQLTARSVIRDFENMAEKETDIEVERGPSRRYRMKAIQTSKSCGIVCMYTSFTTTDTNARNQPQSTRIRHTGTHMLQHRQSTHNLTERLTQIRQAKLHERMKFSLCLSDTGGSISPSAVSSRSQRSVESFFGSKSSKSPTSLFVSPQVHLQLASGAFLLSDSYSECLQIPLDRLKRASPYLSHRSSLSPPFRCTSPPTSMDVESSSWATAVALAWLEHRCAGFFVEWELVAAKADFWLKCQSLPEGVDLAGLRAAARQLFLLLRHWDENIKLNVLCYNPNNM
uniref:von Willebrand factor A domain containing 5B2 n=1 Tax=Sinocyclocheilus anshuiensis TaxID=1608454 RepID=A0A671LV91_9TELE